MTLNDDMEPVPLCFLFQRDDLRDNANTVERI